MQTQLAIRNTYSNIITVINVVIALKNLPRL